jgi:hypothetical protein
MRGSPPAWRDGLNNGLMVENCAREERLPGALSKHLKVRHVSMPGGV